MRIIGSGHRAAPRRRSGGFTLMELLVTTTIAAMLVSATVPPMLGLLRSARVASQVNGFIGDLRYARSQAIRRQQVVSVCASVDGASCAGTTDWQGGWIVFVDADGDGRRGASPVEPLLRAQPAWSDDDKFVADHEASAISFGRNGFTWHPKASVVTLTLHNRRASAEATRCVAIDLLGRAAVQRVGTGECA